MPETPGPGTYVAETGATPPSADMAPTSIAAFIGYTQRAGPGGSDLTGRPTRINGLLEFENHFGGSCPVAAPANRASRFILHDSLRLFFDNGGDSCWIVSIGGFTDPALPALPRAKTVADFKQGIACLKRRHGVGVLAIPDAVLLPGAGKWGRVMRAALRSAAKKGFFVIIDVYGGNKPLGGARDPIDGPRGLRALIHGRGRGFGAAYYPWLLPAGASDPMPPSGAIAGVFARTDAARGVWKAPANVEILGAGGPGAAITTTQQDGLNAPADGKAVNALRVFSGKGFLVWGARTLDSNSGEYRYVPVRRTMIMLKRSLSLALKPCAFEPNDAATWSRVEAMAGEFLTGLWRQGALVGARPGDAFFVACGLGRTMTRTDVSNGILRLEIGVALTRPAEFITLRLKQKTLG